MFVQQTPFGGLQSGDVVHTFTGGDLLRYDVQAGLILDGFGECAAQRVPLPSGGFHDLSNRRAIWATAACLLFTRVHGLVSLSCAHFASAADTAAFVSVSGVMGAGILRLRPATAQVGRQQLDVSIRKGAATLRMVV